MKNISILSAFALSVLLSCKDKSSEPIKEILPVEEIEMLAPLKQLADADPVNLTPEFEMYLIENKIDPDAMPNGSIKYGAIKNVDSLDIFFMGGNKALKGLEYFTNLRYLKFSAYQVPTDDTNRYSYAFPTGVIKEYKAPVDTLDVRYNLNLQYLDVSGASDGGGQRAAIGFLKLGKNEKLKTLVSQFGMMGTMNLSGLSNLENLDLVESYSLKIVRVCNNTQLKNLRSSKVEKFYVADPASVNVNWSNQTGGAAFLKCQ